MALAARATARAPCSARRTPRAARRSAAPAPLRRAVVVQAKEDAFDTEEVIKTLQEKWDATENKSSIAVYGAGAITALWLSSTVVGAVNSVPILPKLMELVGLGYTTWFVYRYLLFKDSRKELVADVDDLKAKISGDE